MTFKNPGLKVVKGTLFFVTSEVPGKAEEPFVYRLLLSEANKSRDALVRMSQPGQIARVRVGRFSNDGKEIRTI